MGGTQLSPRQPMRPAAYAMGLVPGAHVPGADSYLWVPGMTAQIRHDKEDLEGLYIDPSSGRPGAAWIYVLNSAYTQTTYSL